MSGGQTDEAQVGGRPAGVVDVLLVDDHPMFREGLKGALPPSDGFRVVGEAATGEQALALLAGLDPAPHVVVMDLGLPDLSGIEVTRQAVAAHPGCRVLVVTMSDGDDSVLAAMRAGACGYLLKGAGRAELQAAVRTAAMGGAVFSPRIAERLHAFFDALAATPGTQAFPELTSREREILDLLARGLDYRQIARRLVIAPKTVSNHVSSIFAKLQVTDRAQAIVRARNAGLGTDPD